MTYRSTQLEVILEKPLKQECPYLAKGQVSGDVMRRSIRYAIERHRADDALRRSEELYRALVDTSPNRASR